MNAKSHLARHSGLCSSALLLALVFGFDMAQAQPSPTTAPGPGQPPTSFSDRLQSIITRTQKDTAEQGLTRFDLDFPGGTPAELVAAIQKAQARPLNAIVPDEFASIKLPALMMKNVNVAMLFEALAAASRKSEAVSTGQYYGGVPRGGYASYTTTSGYGFRTQSPPTDDSIWYFYVEKPTLPPASLAQPTVCRFYSLTPYLERGLTVDDITTAIETGWNMLGESQNQAGAGTSRGTGSQPAAASIRFHKDTKLLIAVGDPSKLETIDAVLSALTEGKPKLVPGLPVAPPASPAKPAGQPKAEDNR